MSSHFEVSQIIYNLESRRRRGYFGDLEIGSKTPACLAAILETLTKNIVDDLIQCSNESQKDVIDLKHLQAVVVLDDCLRNLVYGSNSNRNVTK